MNNIQKNNIKQYITQIVNQTVKDTLKETLNETLREILPNNSYHAAYPNNQQRYNNKQHTSFSDYLQYDSIGQMNPNARYNTQSTVERQQLCRVKGITDPVLAQIINETDQYGSPISDDPNPLASMYGKEYSSRIMNIQHSPQYNTNKISTGDIIEDVDFKYSNIPPQQTIGNNIKAKNLTLDDINAEINHRHSTN